MNAKETEAEWGEDKLRKYCPKFSKDDYMYGDYYSSKASWYRLAIHFCDPLERIKEGKKCKEENEIEEYFGKTLIGVDMSVQKPSL